MAYMSQDNKAKIAAELKKVIPADWKYTLAVHHHSTLVLTIRQAPVDLIAEDKAWRARRAERPCFIDINQYHLDMHYDGKLLGIFKKIVAAMHVGNHNRSDSQSDYFDVGWYVDVNVGEYDKPFRYVPKAKAQESRPAGMPTGLSREQEMEWMKNRIAQLEGR